MAWKTVVRASKKRVRGNNATTSAAGGPAPQPPVATASAGIPMTDHGASPSAPLSVQQAEVANGVAKTVRRAKGDVLRHEGGAIWKSVHRALADAIAEVRSRRTSRVDDPSAPSSPSRVVVDVVGLGVGSLESAACGSRNRITDAQYQCALLCMIAEYAEQIAASKSSGAGQAPDSADRGAHPIATLFDPVMTAVDAAAAAKLRLHVPASNERGAVRARAECDLLVCYMPHCTHALYSNAIAANWDAASLPKLLIIGNNLASYDTKMPAEQLRRYAPMLHAVLQPTATDGARCVHQSKDLLPHPQLHALRGAPHAFDDTWLNSFGGADPSGLAKVKFVGPGGDLL